MQIGVLGLGKMGSRIAQKLLQEGHDVIVWNRSIEPVENLKSQNPNLKSAPSIEELVQGLDKPRVIWVMLPAGSATQAVLDQVMQFTEPDDIVIDGGNSNFKDTERYFQMFSQKKVRFLGIGVSGGIIAQKEGYPLMVGGDKTAYEYIKPILNSLAKPKGGHEYFGTGGAGHYVKMVHNGIEYGYMQSIGEGFGVLQKSPYDLDLAKVANIYKKGTLVSGFMMERTEEVLQNHPNLSDIAGVIGKASGETVWTIEEAKKQGVPIEIIEQSLEFRNKSQTDQKIQNSFAAKMVAALRNAFGGHEVKKK